MAHLRVALLGSPTLTGPGGPIPSRSHRSEALLWYLAAQPGRMFSRPHLVSLLWTDGSEGEGRHRLTMLLNRLRPRLPVWPLRIQSDSIGWDPDAPAEVDVTRFLTLVQTASPEGTDAYAEKRKALAAAVALWRGPFLDGFSGPVSPDYDDWVQQERTRWEVQMLETLGRLVRLDAEAGDWPALAKHARLALAIDPLQEPFHRWLMVALGHERNRAAALAQYEHCHRILQEELGVEPDPATTALRDLIAGGRVPTLSPSGVAAGIRSAQGPIPTANDPGQAPVPPLIGRREELSLLQRALRRAAAGDGRAVLLEGEAGTGKTRLVEEILNTARGEEGEAGPFRTVLVGRCRPGSRDLPYGPFVEAFTPLPAPALEGLDLPGPWLREAAQLLPDLLPRHPGTVSAPAPVGLQRLRLFEAVARLLNALPGPVLLVLEDIHWADEGTLRLLGHVARHPLTARTGILITCRPEEMDEEMEELLRSLQRDRLLDWQHLPPLTPEHTRLLVQSLTGEENDELGRRVYELTKGNAFFTVEVVRSLGEGTHSGTPGAAAPDPLPLPETVRATLRARLSRLPAPCRELLDALAIFPEPAAFDTVRKVADLSTAHALAALETLIRARILDESEEPGRGSGSGAADGDTTGGPFLFFRHPLIARAVREAVGPARRRLLHRRAVDYLQVALGTLPEPAPSPAPAPAEMMVPTLRWPSREGSASLWAFGYPMRAD